VNPTLYKTQQYRLQCLQVQDKRSGLSEAERIPVTYATSPRKVLYMQQGSARDEAALDNILKPRYHESCPDSLIDNCMLAESIRNTLPDCSRDELIPFIKHWTFWEEEEYRLVVNLRDVAFCFDRDYEDSKALGLSSYIQYGKGDAGADGLPGIFLSCKLNDKDLDCSRDSYLRLDRVNKKGKAIAPMILEYRNLNNLRKQLKKYMSTNTLRSVTIAQGIHQAEVYELVEQVLEENGKRNLDGNEPDDVYCPIWCNGYWPIRGIIVERAHGSELLKDQIETYCKLHHWLKDVYVCESSIPYRKR
jgi:hypothetical protein